MRFLEYWRSFCGRKKREYRLDLKQGLTVLVLAMPWVTLPHRCNICDELSSLIVGLDDHVLSVHEGRRVM